MPTTTKLDSPTPTRPVCAACCRTVSRLSDCSVVYTHAQELSRLGAGQYFGELALLRNEARAASVKAVTAVDLLALSRADFVRLLGPLQDLLATHAAKYCPVSSAKQVNTLIHASHSADPC